jgi:hypothetical protein
MGGQAGQLQEMMAFFKVADQGGGAGRGAPRTARQATTQTSRVAAAKPIPAAHSDDEQNDFERF